MKLSEMTNEQAAEAMIRIAEPISSICDDKEAMKILEEFAAMADETIVFAIAKKLPVIAGYLLKKHRADLYEIIGGLTFKPADEIKGMNFFATVKVMQDSYDEILKSFFTSSATANGTSAE